MGLNPAHYATVAPEVSIQHFATVAPDVRIEHYATAAPEISTMRLQLL